MSLRQKTISGLSWSFIDNLSRHGVSFIFGIVLARLLAPREFGIIGMTSVFLALSQTFIDSGFRSALIRKNNCTQSDYSTVFFFNLATGLTFYVILFLSAGAISNFFNEPKLKLVLPVLGLGIIIHAFTVVQRAILIKNINFKLQTKISVIATLVSGSIGVYLAYIGFGIWSLVIKTLLIALLTSTLLWLFNKWKPSLIFSWQSFKEMFSFSSKLLVSSLIDTAYKNIYTLVIGKYFSAVDLGFYSRASKFKELPSNNITRVIQQVSYPALASIQDNTLRLKAAYQILIKSTMLITFVSMLSMAAIAKPMIIVLIGEQWLPSVIYLQLLCFVGMFFPLHALNLNMLNVKGRSDLFLKIEIIKKILIIPVIVIGIRYGIQVLIIGMIINSLIAYYINSKWSGKLIGYSMTEQLADIFPSFILAVFVAGPVFLIGLFLPATPIIILLVQLFMVALLTIGLTEIFKMKDYLYIKKMITEKLRSKIK